ncbi:MAG: hypothetical protein JW761_03090 [Prolixibacteraceae bacterium]|nr:hypothetical protein [Prolixibacteraceae bacterium]
MNQRILTDDIAIWVENYTQELYSRAFHKALDSEPAADLVQDIFLLQPKNRIIQWRQFAKNLVIQYIN